MVGPFAAVVEFCETRWTRICSASCVLGYRTHQLVNIWTHSCAHVAQLRGGLAAEWVVRLQPMEAHEVAISSVDGRIVCHRKRCNLGVANQIAASRTC